MKMVSIRPAAKPKSFHDVEFLEKEWTEATKLGDINVPFVTAIEAVRNSRGLYSIVVDDEKAAIEVSVGGVKIEEMDNAALKLMAVHLGVTLRNKSIKRSQLRALVKAKLEAIDIVDDDDDDDVSGDDPGDDA